MHLRAKLVVIVVVVVAAVVLAAAAGSRLGSGDGSVPDLVGADECTATDRLADRGLRWRFGDHGPVGGVPARCDPDGGIGSVADQVEAQSPPPGTALPEGAVVVLETACTQEPECSRRERYEPAG